MASVDLDAYFDRIGYGGPVAPTLTVLRSLIERHTQSIPFESLDVLAGRPVKLDLDSLAAKLIHRRRGGYCFEQNTLFRAVLDTIGFRTTGLMGRVRRGFPREAIRPRTHMTLLVDFPQPEEGHATWLADVGFGGLTPPTPLAMVLDLEQATTHEPMRFIAFGSDTLLQAQLNGVWEDIYQIVPGPQAPVDYEVSNWFTATHPASIFRNSVIATRTRHNGRLALFNRVFTRRPTGGVAEKRMLETAGDYRTVLTEAFNLEVTEADIAAILACLKNQAPAPFDPFS
jgi:N-hydroxyarylamine O-acetyltransferase